MDGNGVRNLGHKLKQWHSQNFSIRGEVGGGLGQGRRQRKMSVGGQNEKL